MTPRPLDRPIASLPRRFNRVSQFVVTALLVVLFPALLAQARHPAPLPNSATQTPHRTRLILKDGTYQLVMSYTVNGAVVQFVSAERGGDIEEIPTSLVDLEATKRYEQTHSPQPQPDPQPGRAPAIDPELAREEAERASLTPEVAPDLRLESQDAILLLDTVQGAPELVPLTQQGSDLNKSTGHGILKGIVNPLASSHQIVQIKGTRAAVQAHVDTPVIYLRLGDDTGRPTGSAPLVVDTHSAQGNAPTVSTGGSPDSSYVIVQADVRQDIRILTSFKIGPTGAVRHQEDVVETSTEVLPGGHWMKLTPSRPLGFGEYALMEVLSDREINLGVWDFGVHPSAPDNRDALHPEPRRPVTLERHPRD